MNDSQIYQLCHQKPGIKATEIATALNAELLVVSNALRSLVDVGDLLKAKHFDDATGRSSQVYQLSDEFKRSRHFKDMLGMMNQVKTPAATPAASAEAVEVAQASPAAEKQEVVAQAGVSKVQRAINFIQRFGAASASELREAMGLPDGASVSCYLTPAIKNGRVHCDGKLWKSGAAPEAVREKLGLEQVKADGNVVSAGNLVVDARDQTPVPAAIVAQLAEDKPSAPTAAPPTKQDEHAYRCAIWSDGKVEIEKGYNRIILTQVELAEIAAFMDDRRVA